MSSGRQRAAQPARESEQERGRAERLKTLGEMASGVAHDLNGLLTLILAEAQLLNLRAHDERDTPSLERIERAARDGAVMVRRLQDYVRAEPSDSPEVLELDEVVCEAVELTRPRWRSLAEIELWAEPVGAVRGYASELHQVLINLIFNALDAREQGRACRITIRTARAGAGWALISVEDNGCGIEPAVLPRIFDPYFTTRPQGTGLGLSSAYNAVKRLHGELSAGPLQGQAHAQGGTRFEVRLPLAPRG